MKKFDYLKKYRLPALAYSFVAFGALGSAAAEVIPITFESLGETEGQIIDDEYSTLAGLTVTADGNGMNDPDLAVIYNSNPPVGDDSDLEFPFDGPGGGAPAGNLSGTDVGNLVIIQTDGGEDSGNPGFITGNADDSASGGTIAFTVDTSISSPLRALQFETVDVDPTDGGAYSVTFADSASGLSATVNYSSFVTSGDFFFDSTVAFGDSTANRLPTIRVEDLFANADVPPASPMTQFDSFTFNLEVSGSIGAVVITTLDRDFGDAPDTYGTTLSAGGASHVITPGIQIGSSVDDELDGIAGAAADGDGGDEDGVTFPGGTVITGTDTQFVAKVVVSASSTTGLLTATDEFNTGTSYATGSGWLGDWDETTDDDSPETGAVVIATAAGGVGLGGSALCLNTGLESIERQADFSGAAGPGTLSFSYRRIDMEAGETVSVEVSDGAGTSQVIFTTPAGVGSGSTDGAFVNISLPVPQALLTAATTVRIFSSAGATPTLDNVCFNFITLEAPSAVAIPATLVGWVDFDRSGTFDAGEQQVLDTSGGLVVDGVTENMLMWTGFGGDIITGGMTYARFRLSTDPVLAASTPPTGALFDGEVEDYLLQINLSPATASLGDRVFSDVDGDGVQGNPADEPGIPGVTVRLLDPDNGFAEIASTMTDENGDYLFDNLAADNYVVEFVRPAGFVSSPQDNGGTPATDSDADVVSGRTDTVVLGAGQTNLDVDAGFIFDNPNGAFCVAIADNGGSGDPDTLYRQNLDTGVWESVGATGTTGIETTTFAIDQTLYAADAGIVGTVNMATGVFTPLQTTGGGVGVPIGTLDGPGSTTTNITDIDGMTFDPYRNVIWATHRIGTDGVEDLLFQIDPATGQAITGVFDDGGTAVDYVPVAAVDDPNFTEGDGLVYDVDDIAFDTSSGILYAIQNEGNDGGVLTVLNLSTGAATIVGSFLLDTVLTTDFEALAFDFNGQLFGSTGDSGNNPNRLFEIDKASGALTILSPIAPGGADDDFESLDCFTRPLSLGNLVFNDLDNNGQFDSGVESGIDGVDVQLFLAGANPLVDAPLATVTTAGGGLYLFTGLPEGDFFAYVPQVELAGGGTLDGLVSSTGNEPTPDPDGVAPDLDVNNDDNGDPFTGGGVATADITLTIGGEPTTDGDSNSDSNLTLDLGFHNPALLIASLGNRVFNDLDGDGVQDGGEPGIDGVVVKIFSGTTLVDQTVTSGGGLYTFTGLMPGVAYTVEFERPGGFVPSPQDNGGTESTDSDADETTGRTAAVTLAGGENNPDIDAGFFVPAVIGNYVWLDENGDGVQDAGEPGIPGVTVTLRDSGGNVVGTTVTDADGGYIFTNLPAGTYTVTVTPPAGFEQTFDADGIATADTTSVTVGAGEENLDQDFGYNYNTPAETDNPSPGATAGVGDRVWLDADGDGIQDPGEAGIGGVTVKLLTDDNADGVYGGIGDNVATTTDTDSAGNYFFDGLDAGAYVVMVDGATLPAGLTQTGDPDGVLDGMTTAPVILAPGDVVVIEDFGYQPLAGSDLGDTVYFDADGDGVEGPGEEGIPGVTVVLLDDQGNVVATTTTDENGNYLFPGLPAGDYMVMLTDTDNVLGTLQETQDPDGGVARKSNVTLDGVSDDLDQDFGFTVPGQNPGDGLIGDTIFLDEDADGQPDPGEGLEGVVVELYASNGTTLLATTTTDENGNYYFGNLPVDADGETYIVRVDTTTLPAGVTNTVDPDDAVLNESTVTISTATPIDLAQDFGYRGLNSLSGTVWEDLDADGTLSAETMFFGGVTIDLLDAAGNLVSTTTTDSAGDYSFDNLPDGVFTVDVTDEANVLDGYWKSDGPNDTANNNSQDDLYVVNLDNAGTSAAGVTNETADFGYYILPADIGDFVFSDRNGDGTQNTGDTGIGGVLVKLIIDYPNGDTVVITTLTTAGGLYGFEGLLLDEDYSTSTAANTDPDYTVMFNTPAGFVPTTVDAGGNDATDSDGAMVVVLDLEQGESDLTYDSGFLGDTSKPTNFAAWQALNPLGGANGPGDNPDGDIHTNLEEYALCFHPNTGVNGSPVGTPNDGFCVDLNPGVSPAPDTIDATFLRPEGITDVTYTLEISTDLVTFIPAPANTVTFDATTNGDGTETVVIEDLEQISLLSNGAGFVRLRLTLAAPVATTTTKVFGWQTYGQELQCQTFSHPFEKKSPFSGTVDSSAGNVLTVTTSTANGSFSFVDQLSADSSYYVEILDGTFEGHRFDIDRANSTTTTIALLTDGDLFGGAVVNTLTAVPNLANAPIIVREHYTVDELFPLDSDATAGSNQTNSDTLLFYNRSVDPQRFDVLFLSSAAGQWRAVGGTPSGNQGGRILPPCDGFFSHHRAGTAGTGVAYDRLQIGCVRENDFVCPLDTTRNLVGSPYPLDMSPDERGLRGPGFQGTGDPATADNLEIWQGDVVAGAEGYVVVFYADIATFDQWSLADDPTVQSQNDSPLLESDRGYFYDITNPAGIPDYRITAPWQP